MQTNGRSRDEIERGYNDCRRASGTGAPTASVPKEASMPHRRFRALPGTGRIILIATALLLGHAIAHASPQPGPSIFLHAQPATASKNPCGALNISNCHEAVTRGDLAQADVGPYYYVYLLAYTQSPINALSGLQCGLFYQD